MIFKDNILINFWLIQVFFKIFSKYSKSSKIVALIDILILNLQL